MCTNTNMGQINIDASGWVCNNKWGLQGAWYCYSDPQETNPSCRGTGDIPYVSAKAGMCVSGATAAGSTFGAGVGFVLAQPDPKSTAKPNYNAQAQNIIGFAVTLTGTSGGSVLNIGFPGSATNINGEAPFVSVPGVSGSSPITYNVLFKDARITNQSPIVVPAPLVDPTKLTDVKVVMPNDKSSHTYDFCVTSVVPITAPPTATPSCTMQYGPAWDNGTQFVISGFGNVGVQNNPFDPGHHVAVTTFGGGGCAGFTAAATWSGGAVAAFPSLVYGYALGGTNDGNFYGGYAGGKTIGAIASAKTSWTWSGSAGQYDAAYDVWFAQNPNPKNPGTELMVWLGKGSNNPLGSNSGTTLSAWGTSFSVWTNGTNPTGQPVVSYVASSTMTSITSQDLALIFKDAASHGYAGLNNNSYLLGIQAGFEMYSGSFTTSSYNVNVQ
ncbi:MAG: hypothetical protein M3O36_09055 [Myxococcota bacterium]|nr:hypothetical protein [Myxococcota bacterium]